MYAAAIVLTTAVLHSVASFDYQSTSTCQGVIADPTFSASSTGKYKIYATTSYVDAATDSCEIIENNIVYVTRHDGGLAVYNFKNNEDLYEGRYTQVGPDGQNYKVVALKAYGSECANMNLLLYCSDEVGSQRYPYKVKIQTELDETPSEECLQQAVKDTQEALPTKFSPVFRKLDNVNCAPVGDFCLLQDKQAF